MFSAISAAIAKAAATKPIHFIVIPALLASIAYLSIVDDYIPTSDGIEYYFNDSKKSSLIGYSSSSSSRSSSNSHGWTPFEGDINDYKQITLVPVRFRSFHSVSPAPNSVYVHGNEQVLKVEGDMETITIDGETWKMTSGHMKYYDYARRGYYKILSSIKQADNFDIILITVAYIAMWYTLIKVFIDMKQFGSRFWLAFSTLVSSTFAFLFALLLSNKLDLKVSLLSLTEGIPFLVSIIGFKHKVSIASVVAKASTASPEDVPNIVSQAISSHTLSMFRDHVVVVGALGACAVYASHIIPLRNFCLLSAFILSIDLLLVHTFFAAILALKIEINRARRTEDMQEVLEEDGVSSLVAATVAEQSSTIEYPNEKNFFHTHSILSFKVIMTIGFVSFHLFWLGGSWMESRGAATATDDLLQHIPSYPGTVLVLLPPKFYVHGFASQIEDYIYLVFKTISDAIKDSLISKFLLFGFGVSIVSNIYFLNASRYQVTATNKLIEFSKPKEPVLAHTAEERTSLLKEGKVASLSNDEVTALVTSGKLPLYALEKQLGDNTRAVAVRRQAIETLSKTKLDRLPFANYDYDRVFGACCENVIGYMPLPVGVAGPLVIDGKEYFLPMATTEGCLVASTMRGCKAINLGGGVQTVLTKDGMTRGPCVRFPTLKIAGEAKVWMDSEEGQASMKEAFNSTSRFARLQHIQTALAGTLLYVRFRTTTGDAMGMNMISKGVEHTLKQLKEERFPDMEVVSVSGNYCTDKKSAAINWINGRGKSVVAEARIPEQVISQVLKCDVDSLVEVNVSKNLIGSALAGSIGGFNAHAANLVAALFLALGQDPAQVVEGSNCLTLIDRVGTELVISVSMPCIEVGTIGGGTILDPQGSMLDLLGLRGPHPTNPGQNAQQLAKVVASAVLAAELSLISALAAGHLVQLHMQHNRKPAAGSCIKS